MTHKKLHGQVAIVTGASRGIGKAVGEQLAAAGATVVLAARNQEQVEGVAAALRQQGGNAIGVAGDVGDRSQVEALTKSAFDKYGRVDIVVNNAAVLSPIEEVIGTDVDAWAYNIQVNLLGPFYLARSVLPFMVEQGYGRIVNVSSGAAINPIVGASAYSSAKAGLDMFTRSLAQEIQNTGVTVTSFHPGMVDTGMQVDLRSVDTSGTRLDFTRFHNAYKQGQLRSPGDVARAVLWLAGPWSHEQNGKIFRIADEEWIRQVNTDLADLNA
jgi:NAD(P)-dependent dehydrogenase (short-subunit alcohol dehydrogenase family)